VSLSDHAPQLATARELQREHDLEFPLLEASAEDVPLAAGSFDLVVSEYGASIWADPYPWIAEAARLLRPGGEVVFLFNGPPLVVEDLVAVRAPEGADPGRWEFVTAEWARQWPGEEIWKARTPA
jgi:SAM-dependent methyltransferase